MTRSRLLPLLLPAAALMAAGFVSLADFEPGGSVRIDGTSNVHGWHCTAPRYSGTFAATGTGAVPASIERLTFTVPVASIDCNNGTMNGKLRDALKARAHPTIVYTLQTARIGAAGANGRFSVESTGQLAIAGQTQPVAMTVQGQSLGGGRYRFTGSTPVSMRSYGIGRITALMGTMRVGERVTVAFDVTVAR